MKPLRAAALFALASACNAAGAQTTAPKAEVVHWWTSSGEAAAVQALANAYRAAGGIWTEMAVAQGEQARAVAFNRIVGGNPPTAAQLNISASGQFLEMIERGMLNPVDEVAARDGWERFLPEVVLSVIRVKGHYYAVPVNIHMPAWIWYSKDAFRRAGITAEPRSMDELFAALDKLRAAGLVPLAHGGQAWHDSIVFAAVLANQGGRALYLKVLRDGDRKAILSDAFRSVLLSYKRLQGYVDAKSPGRNWNEATAMLTAGKAGVQFMGDWAKSEFAQANQVAGRDYGCIAGFGPDAPYIVQGDVFVFPKTHDPGTLRAQQLLARVASQPSTQVAFNMRKGSVPIRSDIDASKMDACAQQGIAIVKGRSRLVGNGEMYMTRQQNLALSDIVTAYWDRDIAVEKVQRDIAAALGR